MSLSYYICSVLYITQRANIIKIVQNPWVCTTKSNCNTLINKDMNSVRKQIEVTPETRKEIKRAFQCSDMAMWRALSFALDTDLSRRIRKMALMKGGVVLCITPEIETIHDANGYMRQYFSNGAMIEVDKNTGTAEVVNRNGDVMEHIDDCSIKQLNDLQTLVQTI